MNYEYIPNGVCSRKMQFKIENDIIKDIHIIGGCPGNLLGIRALIIGKNINDIINTLNGIKCGIKTTSCPDQIAKALIKYKEKETN